MKAHIKKGLKKRNERTLEHYRLRFRKLYSMINIWKHYVVLYFRIQEDRYYEKLYKERNRRAKKREAQEQTNTMQGQSNKGVDSTLKLDTLWPDQHEMTHQTETTDDLSRLNIHFFIEEMFFYMLEIMHATAAMAYT